MTGATAAVEWLHILGGITWFGGYVFLDFIVWPGLLRLPPVEAVRAHDAIFPSAARIMAWIAPLTAALGIVRGTILGDLHSATDFVKPYGMTWIIALVLSIVLMVWGAGWHEHWLGPVWADGTVLPHAVRRIKFGVVFEMTAFSGILACMVLMGLGW